MKINTSRRVVRIKPKVRIWSVIEGSLEEVVPYKQFFFEWKGGCLLGDLLQHSWRTSKTNFCRKRGAKVAITLAPCRTNISIGASV